MDAIIRFDNQYQVKDETNIGTIKVLMLKGDRGEPGYSGNYTMIMNKPRINGVELAGNKTASNLSLASAADFNAYVATVNSLSDAIDAAQEGIDEHTAAINELSEASRYVTREVAALDIDVGTQHELIEANTAAIALRAPLSMFAPVELQPTVPTVSGVTVNYFHVIKSAYTVTVDIYLSTTASFSTAATLMSGLPQPLQDVYETMGNWAATYKRPLLCRISTNGNLTIEHGEAGTNYRIHICYIAGSL